MELSKIEEKCENVFNVAELRITSTEEYTAFYSRFRQAICNNMKKMGFKLRYLNDEVLLEDEILSPTFEEVIILWCLEKIDHKLPQLTNQAFSHKLTEGITLKDLQDEIFQNIPEMMKSRLKEEGKKVKIEAEDGDFYDDIPEALQGYVAAIYEGEDSDEDYIQEDEKIKPYSSKKVECNECGKLFASESRLKLHTQNSHKIEACVCEFCDDAYTNRMDLVKHIRAVHKVSYSCKCCSSILNNQRQYERHLKKVHEEEYPGMYTHKIRKYDFVCRYCQEPQANYKALKAHTAKHRENEEMHFEADNLSDLTELVVNGKNHLEDVKEENEGPDNNIDSKDFEHLDEVAGDLISKMNGAGGDLNHAKVDDINHDDDAFDVENLSNTDIGEKEEEPGGPEECEFCDSSFKVRHNLQYHIRTHHKVKFKCRLCGDKTTNHRFYEQHLAASHKDRFPTTYKNKKSEHPHVCRYCHDIQATHEALREHTLGHKEAKEISFVGEKFVNVMMVEKDTKKQICDICGKSVKDIKLHKKIHQTVNMSCTICDVKFPDEKSSRMHMKWHEHQEKNAFCEQCGKGFSRRESLKKHKKIHDVGGEKLRCPTCKRTFYNKHEMGTHICKHYSCDICGEKFLRARNLGFHKRMHMGEALYSCDQCESMFLKKKRLSDHIRTVHQQKKHQCDICEKFFQSKSNLSKHRLNHTGERRFKCEICGLNYARKSILDRHMMLHTGEKPYQCGVCSHKFRTTGELKFHREFKKCGITDKSFCSM